MYQDPRGIGLSTQEGAAGVAFERAVMGFLGQRPETGAWLGAAGVTIGQERWAELADIAQTRIGDHSWAFADLHYVLCLAGARRHQAVGEMLASIRTHAQQHDDTQAMVHAEIGLATASAIAAAMAGDDHYATQLFSATAPQHHRLGGSNAQRDLLRQMHARAGVAARAAARG